MIVCLLVAARRWRLALAAGLGATLAAPASADVVALASAQGTTLMMSLEGAAPAPQLPPDARTPPQDAGAGSIPDDATLEANGAVFGEVIVHAGDIFDPEAPGESNVVFRIANKIHVNTREGTIRHQLPFRPGDRYSRSALEEAGRILRANGYLYDATIRPVRYDGERVDVEVKTRDVWTLGFGLGVGRAGGANSTRFGVDDQNFFGTGKDVAIRYSSDVDRTETLYRYRDPNLFGTKGRMQISYSDLSDGKSSFYSLDRPFYSLSTRWALGAASSSDARIDPLYSRGVVTGQFRHESTGVEVYGGRSRGLVAGRARRLTFGFSHHEDRFSVPDGLATPVAAAPPDRLLSFPWIGFEVIEDGYFTVQDMDQIQRTEDHNLGRETRGRLGFSSPATGGDRNRLVYDVSFSQGVNPGNAQMLFVTGRLSGRWGGDGAENLLLSGGARYFMRDMGEHMFYVSLEGSMADNLDPENQLLLGGDNGIRGYPLRWVDGDRRVILTVEQRFYMPWHVMKLVHLGAAVFYDAGSAWWSGDTAAVQQPFLQDVGVGLRLSSSRSSKGGMMHIDLAFPINPPDGIPRYQLYVKAGERF